jgi:hypothetical protein
VEAPGSLGQAVAKLGIQRFLTPWSGQWFGRFGETRLSAEAPVLPLAAERSESAKPQAAVGLYIAAAFG